ncbi:hypothetical protein [Raoultella terrigena]|uniref:hypothetical protein n=1 Tax=Raoultella terrigena TaxID=577 RepID=UPI000F4D1204|nr:hypothetical protein [Raoultella terrigena]ROS03655.1 hypothetical protein EDF76_1681 [Raoultella terrigena]
MTNSQYLYEHVAPNDPRLLQFAEQLNPSSQPILVPVIDAPGPAGNAYWNVEAAINKVGGKMRLGWDIHLWRGCFMVATHHAVLQTAEGEFFDVTQRPPVSGSPSLTTFIADDSVSISLDKSPAVASRFLLLNESPEIAGYVRAYENLNQFEKRMSDALYEYGYRCETNRTMATGVPGAKANLINVDEAKISEIRDKIAELSWIMKDKIIKLKRYSDSINGLTRH